MQGLIDAGLISAQRAAALKDEDNPIPVRVGVRCRVWRR